MPPSSRIKFWKKENASVLALPLIIMLAVCVIKYVGYCQSGKGFLFCMVIYFRSRTTCFIPRPYSSKHVTLSLLVHKDIFDCHNVYIKAEAELV